MELKFKPKKNFKLDIKDDILKQGHLACQGCGLMPALRFILQVLGRRTIIIAPACCYVVIDGPFPYSASGVPVMDCAFESTAATASGVKAALDVLGLTDITVLGLAGDGGTFDIGLQALSAAAERNENILYICYDNEAYMNTGIQRSSATPKGSWTTTTPAGALKKEPKKDLGLIMSAHRIPYFATCTLAFLDDMMEKVEKAKKIQGFRLLHYLSPCPTGWKTDSRYMVKLSRLAVETNIFPLYEIFDGDRYVINYKPEGLPVREYFKLQGRFAYLTDAEINEIQDEVNKCWEKLKLREKMLA